jgi:hypothetical protein
MEEHDVDDAHPSSVDARPSGAYTPGGGSRLGPSDGSLARSAIPSHLAETGSLRSLGPGDRKERSSRLPGWAGD